MFTKSFAGCHSLASVLLQSAFAIRISGPLSETAGLRGRAIFCPFGAGPCLLRAIHDSLCRISFTVSVGSRLLCDANLGSLGKVLTRSCAAHLSPGTNGTCIGEAAGLNSGGISSAVRLFSLTGEGLVIELSRVVFVVALISNIRILDWVGGASLSEITVVFFCKAVGAVVEPILHI